MQVVTSKQKAQRGVLHSISPFSHAADFDPQGSRSRVRQILRGPRLQPKLTIGAPDDIYEQEAERVADEVMRLPEPGLQAAPD